MHDMVEIGAQHGEVRRFERQIAISECLWKNPEFPSTWQQSPWLARLVGAAPRQTFPLERSFFKILSWRACGPPGLLLHAAPPEQFGAYHDAVVAELVDAQR
ncbi:hypothetical protein [Rhizobium sp. AAP43]|uniref:hypothetical protein n=1 Tax=Rhizobium sp. AAP43 TaxID=1523420 RepID=UPI0012E21A76|nr:hypothetical protein [Rhizobium sp. AAP43]